MFGCYNCDCGGEVAFNNCYVSIYDVQRLCDIVKHMETVSVEGEEIAEYMRNELERMVVEKSDVQPVKRGKWRFTEKLILGNPYGSYQCSECMYHVPHEDNYCPNCGADMQEPDATKG